jgi:four helix bundle protein
VPSSIAEGFERDPLMFDLFSYARGSCDELRTQIHIDPEIGYLSKEIGQAWMREAIEISSMISSLMKTRRSLLKK